MVNAHASSLDGLLHDYEEEKGLREALEIVSWNAIYFIVVLCNFKIQVEVTWTEQCFLTILHTQEIAQTTTDLSTKLSDMTQLHVASEEKNAAVNELNKGLEENIAKLTLLKEASYVQHFRLCSIVFIGLPC